MEHSLQVFCDILIGFGTSMAIVLILGPILYLFKKLKNGTVEIELPNSPIKINPNKQLINSARIAYVEIANRKMAIEFSEDTDAISEIYDSYYSSFEILRNLLKNLSHNGKEGELYKYINGFMNEVLRNHLGKYQQKYRAWLKREKEKKNYLDENTQQKKYQLYNEIVDDIKELNKKSIKMLIVLESIAYRTKSRKEKTND